MTPEFQRRGCSLLRINWLNFFEVLWTQSLLYIVRCIFIRSPTSHRSVCRRKAERKNCRKQEWEVKMNIWDRECEWGRLVLQYTYVFSMPFYGQPPRRIKAQLPLEKMNIICERNVRTTVYFSQYKIIESEFGLDFDLFLIDTIIPVKLVFHMSNANMRPIADINGLIVPTTVDSRWPGWVRFLVFLDEQQVSDMRSFLIESQRTSLDWFNPINLECCRSSRCAFGLKSYCMWKIWS